MRAPWLALAASELSSPCARQVHVTPVFLRRNVRQRTEFCARDLHTVTLSGLYFLGARCVVRMDSAFSFCAVRTGACMTAANLSIQSNHSDDGVSYAGPVSRRAAMLLTQAEILHMDELGIRYVAGNFLYRTYRYQVLDDAINYAELERGRPDYQEEVAVQPVWLEPVQPTNGDWRVMHELGIRFDGMQFHLLDWRYDHFQDAINQARLRRRETFGEDRPPNRNFP
jgi:hypothetical protein